MDSKLSLGGWFEHQGGYRSECKMVDVEFKKIGEVEMAYVEIETEDYFKCANIPLCVLKRLLEDNGYEVRKLDD